MADLSTHYLGLDLKSPVIAGSSGLMKSLSNIQAAEKAGAGAVVLKSIFEEQIRMEMHEGLKASDLGVHPEAADYISRLTREHGIDEYLKLVSDARKAVNIPVIASINCIQAGDWIEFSSRLGDAGADAIELNVMISDFRMADSSAIEWRYMEILSAVKGHVNVPVSLKIGSQFTNLPHMAREFCDAEADGLVLFNRYRRQDIDPEKRQIIAASPFSEPAEIAEPLKWIAILSGSVECDLCASTGVHDGLAALKMIMAGAKAVQVCSALYQNGIPHISKIIGELDKWMDNYGYANLDEIRGIMGSKTRSEAEIWGRAQFMQYYSELE